MTALRDITGQKFSRLTALYRLHNDKRKRVHWLCICECGNFTEAASNNLLNSKIKSCGCLHNKGNHTTHRQIHTRLYRIWSNMKDRCTNSNTPSYKNYGGRNIVVCDEWQADFMAFYNWAMNNGYQDDLTIDRIDVNGNYEPSNCRWRDKKAQARNTRRNNNITIKGETRCLSEWCEILNLNYNTIHDRIYKLGWSIERALELNEGSN